MTEFGTAASRLSGAAAMLLGWRPCEFWDSTPAELASAFATTGTAEGAGSDELAELMRRFPDERDDNG